MKEVLIVFLSSWASTAMFTVLGSAIVGLFGLLALTMPKVWAYLKSLVDSNTSGKVQSRLQDAINKLSHISSVLIDAEKELCKKEIQEYLKDGRIDKTEIQDLASKLADKAIQILSPEVNTFKNYLTGDLVKDYVTSFIMSKLLKKFGLKSDTVEVDDDVLANSPAIDGNPS